MKYVLSVFAVIILLLLIIVLIFRGSPDQATDTTETEKPKITLADYESKPAVLSLTTRGAVTADEDRRAIRVSVSRQERVIEILEGYSETVVKRQVFPNSEASYKVFLSALTSAGFGIEQETEIRDERGVCPFGRRFIYKLQDGSEQVLRTWSVTCGRSGGSFGGNSSVVRRLFERQIPEYRTVIRGVKL